MAEFSDAERNYRDELERRGAARAPATLSEVWDSEWRRSGLDTMFGQARHLSETHDELVAAIEGASGKRIAEFARENGVAFDGTVEGRIAALGRLVDLLPDEEQRKTIEPLKDVRARAAEKAQKIEKEAAEISQSNYSLSGVATSFAAGLARQMVDPGVIAANIATAPIGGPFKGPFLPVVARQGLSGAAGQAILEPSIQRGRGELGLESGFGHAAGNVLEAGLGSAGLTAVLRIGAAGVRAVRRRVAGESVSEAGTIAPGEGDNAASGAPTGSLQADLLRTRVAALLAPEDMEAAARFTERNQLLESRRPGAPAELEATAGAMEAGRPVDRAAAVLAGPELDGRIGAGAATRSAALDPNRFAPVDNADRQFVIRPGGGRLAVTERVVELKDLIASHDLEGRPNAAYPAELQPRDRSAPASRSFVAEKAAALEPELLGPSPTAATGAPVIGPDGVVESGNGRVMMIARAYDRHPERAAAYRDFLEQQGHATEGMEFPVLVRVREGKMELAERAAFAREANVAPVASMSVRERAFADVKALDENLLATFRGGDMASAENTPFVRAFADRVVAPEERPNFIGADDRISADGARRIEAALVARAWEAPDIVAALYESAEPTSKAILGAFADTAPLVARLRAAIAEGRLGADVDPAPAMLEAFRLVDRARGAGEKVADVLEQLDLERGAVSPAVKDAARLFFRDDQFRLGAGREAIAARIEQAVNRALDQQNAIGDLFGAAFDTAGTLRAAKLAGQTLGEQDLFGGAATGSLTRGTVDPATFAAQRRTLIDAQPYATAAEGLENALKHQARFIAALEEAAAEVKGVVKNPGVKASVEAVEAKIVRKGYDSARQVTDLVRGGIVVARPEDAEPIIASLARRFRVIDEQWFQNPAGYFDRKLEVILPDGTMAEVQLWPREIYEAKAVSNKLPFGYETRRAMPEEAKAALIEQERDYWADVRSRLDAAWGPFTGGSPNASRSLPNAARAASSESGLPSQVTSSRETGSQPRSGESTNAPSDDTTATRLSQSNQSAAEGAGIDASKGNVSASLPEIKALRQDADRTLADVGDFEIAIPAADGTVRKISARQALLEAEEDAAAAAELTACIGEELAA